MVSLPLVGLAYTVSSASKPRPYMIPIFFAGAVGFLSILAIAECHGLIMETYDTCDADVRRRRTAQTPHQLLRLPSRDSWDLALPYNPADGYAVTFQGAGHSESCVRDMAQYGR